MSLFQALPDQRDKGARPLADRMRPRTLDEFVGQEQVLAPGKPLRMQIERDDPGSIIFWGPPGVGKTTLAQIIAHITKEEFIEYSEVLTGCKENMHVHVSEEILRQIASYSSGDARAAYNVLEVATATAGEGGEITEQIIKDTLQKRILLYDKSGEEHFNLISALHKSVRNSDVDASLYWLGRMLASGEDPLYIARRVVRMAVEDIGLASPQALSVTLAAHDAYDFLGTPEGELALAQAVAY